MYRAREGFDPSTLFYKRNDRSRGRKPDDRMKPEAPNDASRHGYPQGLKHPQPCPYENEAKQFRAACCNNLQKVRQEGAKARHASLERDQQSSTQSKKSSPSAGSGGRYVKGMKAQYYSRTDKQWIEATVMEVHDDGTYTLRLVNGEILERQSLEGERLAA